TAHGIYKGTPKLNFDRLEEINNIVDIPLVLHGGSSTGFKNLTRCATSGISKINIYSDFLKAAIESVNESSINDYIQLKKRINDEMAKVINTYFDVFKTDNYLS
ncbi:class II fructose-bisphosphate aldolase, partial [Globicatella sulfidifaciens]